MKKSRLLAISLVVGLLSGCVSNRVNTPTKPNISTQKNRVDKIQVDRKKFNKLELKALDICLEDLNQAIFYVKENLRANPNRIRAYYTRAIVYGYWGDKLKNKEYASLAWND